MLIEAAEKRFVWDEEKGEYVLSDEKMKSESPKSGFRFGKDGELES